ncbi:MAG: TrbI F-type domain-containing protein [Novosphingobium sp.]|uniref:TrbI F-type domain-containing protein n=1 Tax=Novosphingobium sp. TaxID=1874826 RepID=UPI002732C803|nr:TrbI F-type domain-containing protein [Novosphingobium sp.]MDP3551163.1 TrbI F-type domain-containing protein [Novosphingobium sp.]
MDWKIAGLIGATVAAGLWGAWVTHEVLSAPAMPTMVRVQLSSIIGEYVTAQARSQTPPDRVTAETKAFMGAVQRNLEARGARGQVVLVGEAVLAGDVPDVTMAVRREVYARIPAPGSNTTTKSNVLEAMRRAMAPGAVATGARSVGGAEGEAGHARSR